MTCQTLLALDADPDRVFPSTTVQLCFGAGWGVPLYAYTVNDPARAGSTRHPVLTLAGVFSDCPHKIRRHPWSAGLNFARSSSGVGEVERTEELDWGLLVRRTVHSGSSHNYEERNAPCFPLHKSQRRFLPLALAACGSMSEQMTRQSMRNAFMIRILYLGRSGGPGELEQLQGVGASRVARPRFP